MSTARKIEYVPLDDLKADPRNPKSHDVETIDASVGRFGLVDLIVVDGRTGYIVSGHGRTKTLRSMRDRGETAPEGVRVDKDGTWLVPVSSGWSSRSDSEAAAALIAMNRTTELGGWVDDALLDLLADLNVDDAGLDGIGFDTKDIDDLHKLLRSHSDDDLDDLADEWDGTGMKPAEDAATVLRLKDDATVSRWSAVRADYSNDDEALGALLDAWEGAA